MSRPEHLSCVNTAEGIRRINAEQERYDQDPQAYEAREMAEQEARMQEAQHEAEQQAMAEQEYYDQQDMEARHQQEYCEPPPEEMPF